MVFNESISLLNCSNSTNVSQNLTTMIINQCPSCPQTPETSLFTQIFPIITLILGAILTFLVDYFKNKMTEAKEIRRYEYVLIDDLLEIMSKDNSIDEMVNYYKTLRKDPRFVKTENYQVILDYVLTTTHGEKKDLKKLIDIHKKLIENL